MHVIFDIHNLKRSILINIKIIKYVCIIVAVTSQIAAI